LTYYLKLMWHCWWYKRYVFYWHYTHTHTHPFNGPFSGTTQVSRYQKGNTNLEFCEARDSEWQWHQLGRMQVCTSLQTDNHVSTPLLSFLQAGCPSCRPTNSVKALKALQQIIVLYLSWVYFTLLCNLLFCAVASLELLPVSSVMQETACTTYRTGEVEITSRLSGIPVFVSCTFTLLACWAGRRWKHTSLILISDSLTRSSILKWWVEQRIFSEFRAI